MPPEEDEYKGDTSSFTSCELQMDDSHSLPPRHSTIEVLVSPTTSTGERVEGSRGLCGSPQCPPWWWPTAMDHIEEEDPATLPTSFSLAPKSLI